MGVDLFATAVVGAGTGATGTGALLGAQAAKKRSILTEIMVNNDSFFIFSPFDNFKLKFFTYFLHTTNTMLFFRSDRKSCSLIPYFGINCNKYNNLHP